MLSGRMRELVWILWLSVLGSALLVGASHAEQAGAVAAGPAPARNIVILGDSLSAAFGIDIERGWVRLLEQRLAVAAPGYVVRNLSISGETTRGGLARIDAALARWTPALVVVELAGNDGLRGLSLSETRANLTAIVDRSLAAGAQVVLVGIRLPPNLGPVFNERFYGIFLDLSREKPIALVPFLLEGIGGVDSLMQADGIHPTEAAQPLMLEHVWDVLAPMLSAGAR
jgi:acyl-CoA thioesterase-1